MLSSSYIRRHLEEACTFVPTKRVFRTCLLVGQRLMHWNSGFELEGRELTAECYQDLMRLSHRIQFLQPEWIALDQRWVR